VAQPLSSQQNQHLSKDLGLQIVDQDPQDLFYLCFQQEKLSLKKRQSREHGIFVDFLDSEKEFMRQKISPKKDLLAKAIGLEKDLKVCDLTLGLAGDSFKLCYFGAQVHAFEKNKSLWALSQNALWRYQQSKNHELRLSLTNTSFLDGIDSQLLQNDVFYLDPMYSHERSALPRKEMQYLAELTEPNTEVELRTICEKIFSHKKKLVIKRAPQAPQLCGFKPKRSVEGKMVRFDVY
jgi:16S rRNA (guanine1516-N2)-methyltransferase